MCILVLYLTVLLLSLITNPLMEVLLPQGVFILFAVLSAMATVFLYFYLGETRGLTRAQKKAIYVPGALWGRKLKPNEQSQSPYMPSNRKESKYSTLKTEEVDDLNLNQTAQNSVLSTFGGQKSNLDD